MSFAHTVPADVKPEYECVNCGCACHIARTLTGVGVRDGTHYVWVHTASGWNPCWMRANGTEVQGSPRVEPRVKA